MPKPGPCSLLRHAQSALGRDIHTVKMNDVGLIGVCVDRQAEGAHGNIGILAVPVNGQMLFKVRKRNDDLTPLARLVRQAILLEHRFGGDVLILVHVLVVVELDEQAVDGGKIVHLHPEDQHVLVVIQRDVQVAGNDAEVADAVVALAANGGIAKLLVRYFSVQETNSTSYFWNSSIRLAKSNIDLLHLSSL